MISTFWKLLFDQVKITEVVSLFIRNYYPWFNCYKNHFFDVCHNSACNLFSLIFLPLSTCFPCPWVFSHMLTMSHDLFLPSFSQWLGVLYCCYYLAFICRVLGQICSRRITLSHALIERLGHLVCFFENFRFSIYNTNHMHWLLTVVVITVECGVRHSVQNHQLLHRHLLRIIDSRRCKTSSIGQCVGLFIPRSSVQFWQKLKTLKTRGLKSTWIWAAST